jgi:endonuclease/exonuclease/phosphatase family metal-dependent hydrolase
MTSWTRRALACALTLTLIIAPALAEAAQRQQPVDLTVMTRNIYLGGNIFGPLEAGNDRAEFERLAGELWAEVQGTDFVGTRAELLEREIRRTKPDLVGLQEVALWRRGPDGVKDGANTRATEVVYNFLKTFRRRLARGDLRYTPVVKQRAADIETSIDAGYDVRLTMFDVILVKQRKDLRVIRKSKSQYETSIGVPTPAGDLRSRRGWTAVDVRFKGKRFRFVNTHLESATDATREAQARELVAPGGPLSGDRRHIVVGDFNSDPQGRESPSGAFDILADFGLVDTWRFGPGYSCCLAQSDARDTNADAFDHRIDLILAKPRLRAIRGEVVGDEVGDRAPNGLWPSDHAGVVTKLRLP